MRANELSFSISTILLLSSPPSAHTTHTYTYTYTHTHTLIHTSGGKGKSKGTHNTAYSTQDTESKRRKEKKREERTTSQMQNSICVRTELGQVSTGCCTRTLAVKITLDNRTSQAE